MKRKLVKLLWIHFLVWLALSAALAAWVYAYIEGHPLPPRPDGSVPLSRTIPVAGFAMAVLFLMLCLNAAHLGYKYAKAKKKVDSGG